MPQSVTPLVCYLVAGGLFTLSNALCIFAMPWLIYDLTGSPVMMGAIAFVTLLPAIAGSLFGGLLVDRFSIRRIAVLAAAFNLVPMASIAWLLSSNSLTVMALTILVFLASVLDGPGQIAFEARWPEVARIARIPLFKANAIDDMIENLAMVIGPAIAALIIHAFGTVALLWAVTGVSAAGLLVTVATFPNFRNMKIAMKWRNIFDGIGFLARSKELRLPLLLSAVAIAVWVALETVIIPAALRSDGKSAIDFSAYLAASGLGAILINLYLVAKNITPPIRPLYVLAFTGFALSLLALSVDQSTTTLFLAGFVTGLAVGPLVPAFNTVVLTLTPKSMRARVNGVIGSLILSLSPLGAFIAGVGVENWGAQISLLVCTALLLTCAFGSLILTNYLPASGKSK